MEQDCKSCSTLLAQSALNNPAQPPSFSNTRALLTHAQPPPLNGCLVVSDGIAAKILNER